MLNANNYIGNYRIIKELSRGASGVVYLAQHTHLTNRLVAVKLLQVAFLPSQQDRDSFLREASFLELLKHPSILPIFDVGIHEGFPYIIAEYAPNGSLKDRLQMTAPGLLPAQEVLRTLTQVGQALHFAHQRNIIHRDIKPANILYNAKGDALLADFNIAMQLDQTGTQHADTSGTPYYMAPEQFEGVISKKSDQYALGCIAYELVTGQRPFTALDWHVIALKHARETPIPPTQFNQQLPRHIEAAILKAMAKDRNERHEDVQAFILALNNQQSTGAQPAIQGVSSQALTVSETNIPTVLSAQLASGIIPPVEQTPHANTPVAHIQPISQPAPSSPGAEVYYPTATAPTAPDRVLYPSPQLPPDLHSGITDPNAQGRYGPATPIPASAFVPEHYGAATPTEQSAPRYQEAGAAVPVGAIYNPVPPVRPQQDGKRRSKRGLFLILASIILVLLLAGGGTLFALSKFTGNSNHVTPPPITAATVTITPTSKMVQKSFTILEVTGNPDSSQRQVAGAHFLPYTSNTEYATVNTTGQGTHPAVEATGTLTITSHLSASQAFSAGNTETYNPSSGPPIAAQLTQTGTVNPGGTITLTAFISSPTGSKSNIAAGAMDARYCLNSDPNCPGDGSYFNLTNSAFTGGADAQPYTYVLQGDINAAQSAATAMEPALEQQAKAQITSQLQTQEQLTGDPTCTPYVSTDHSVNDIASTVTASVYVKCTAEAYNPQKAQALAQTLLTSDPSFAFVGKITTTLQKVQSPNAQGIIPIVFLSESLEVYQFSDSYKQTLISGIEGESTQAARSFLLTQKGVQDATITLISGNTLPTKAGQITLNISNPT